MREVCLRQSLEFHSRAIVAPPPVLKEKPVLSPFCSYGDIYEHIYIGMNSSSRSHPYVFKSKLCFVFFQEGDLQSSRCKVSFTVPAQK